MLKAYDRYREAFLKIPKPLAFVDLDYFDENCRAVLNRAGSKTVRIASKSIRCRALLARILKSNPRYQGIMAYHAREAVFLSQHGFDDLLIAYPAVDAQALQAVAERVALGRRITLMVDCEKHIELAQQAAKAHQTILPICMDVDMSTRFPGLHFGVLRSGIRQLEDALALYALIQKQDALRLEGIMGYEAQIAGVGNQMQGRFLKNQIISLLQNWSLPKVKARREAIVCAIGAENLRFVNAGGTGSLESSAAEALVTEVTAGSAFYAPGLFDHYSRFQHLPAAGFALEITRQPEPDIFTCQGGGFIASGAMGKEKLPLPWLPADARLLPNEGAGEVQTPVQYRGKAALQIGDPIFFRHAKAGELCEHFNQLYLVQDGKVVDCVPTYRGEGQDFAG